ncbi:MAG: ABC transporter permease DevC [Gemmataceae bacterium]
MLRGRVPLAWLNLSSDWRRCLVCVSGIAFAVVLMFLQIGFLNALLDGTVALIRWFDADLVIVSKSKYSMVVDAKFARSRLYQSESIPGVASARPLYVEMVRSIWRVPGEKETPPRNIRVVAFEPDHCDLLLPGVQASYTHLQLPDTVLLDAKSKWEFGPAQVGATRELNNKNVEVVGLFELGTDFVNDGNVVTGAGTFAKLFPRGRTADETLSQVDIGLIKLQPGANALEVQYALETFMGEDVHVLTRQQYLEMERDFWYSHTPVGFVFGLGTAIGFVVGTVICYQILSSDVVDHLPEYATLKAIGYKDRYLSGVVLQEGIILALLGFLPGLFISAGLYHVMEMQTGLPLQLTWPRLVLVLVLTVCMCVFSGMLALQKVKQADPADLY